MQTSNKLLLAGFIAAILSFTVFLSVLRANIKPVNVVQGNGVTVTKDLALGTFEGISNHSDFDIKITQGLPSASITADENLLPLLKTKIVDGQLRISTSSEGEFNSNNPFVLRIQIPSIQYIEQGSTGKVTMDSLVSDQPLVIKTSGAGRVFLNNLKVNHLEIIAKDAGFVKVGGQATTLKAEGKNTGRIHAEDLTTQSVDFDCKDNAYLRVEVLQQLNGQVNNSGSVSYTGNPKLSVIQTDAGIVKKWKE